MLIVETSWTPRLTEPTRDHRIEQYLTDRGLYADEQGAMLLGSAFCGMVDPEAELRGPWVCDSWEMDLQEVLLAEILIASCACLIWWKVTCEGQDWCIYAGQLEDRVGFCCIKDPKLEIPLVWTSAHPEIMRQSFDLMEA